VRLGKHLLALTVALLCLQPGAPAAEDELGSFLDRLEAAWKAHDAAGYVALWDASPETLEGEAEVAQSFFSGDETQITLLRPNPVAGARTAQVHASVFFGQEPRARVADWRLSLARRERGWAIVSRDELGAVDGLVHLSLDPAGFKADGLAIKLEDFELKFHRGTLFFSPPSLGPTLLIFAGDGEVRFRPQPAAEREQLRQFCGSEELHDRVGAAFLRIHPSDLHQVLFPVRLEPDPDAPRRLPTAQRIFREQSQKTYVLDASLPRSPWWLMPGVNDASVTFEAGSRRTLTYNFSSGDPEDITFFDRQRRIQICSYPSGGRPARYSEDDSRTLDILSHDLRVRFQPEVFGISGEDTLRIRLLAAVSTLRLRLHDSLRVLAVTSPEGGNHLFFRVRDQSSLVVALGPLSGRVGDITLRVRYAGSHDPAPIEHELLQLVSGQPTRDDDELFVERVPVYTNRTAWYPRADNDDYAKARLRLEGPAGIFPLSGGELVASGTGERGTFAEYRLEQPAKYPTAAVGRVSDLGMRQEGDLALRGFGLPRTRGAAQELMLDAEKVFDFYRDRFGPCPYPFVNLGVTEWKTPGGHSPPGLILVQIRPPLISNRALPEDPANFSDIPGFFLAHELAHQWWGQGVAPANYRERWLSEAWAQYAAALWVQKSRGEGTFRDMLDRFARWAVRFTDSGPIHLGHRLGHVKNNPQVFRAVVYDKGAYVLHMLRAIVGDEAFFRGAREFQHKFLFSKAGSDDLREALESASGQDLRPFFDEWIYGTTIPQLRYGWRSETPRGGGARTAVRIEAQDLPGEVPLAVTLVTDAGRDTRSVRLPARGGSFSFDSTSPTRRVELNADRALLVRVERTGY
jgi:Peptidase family M1 domain